eukprot:PITA_20885
MSKGPIHPKGQVNHCTDSLRPNWALPFHIHGHASHEAIGATLGEIDENFTYSIYFISKNLSKAELNYTVIEKELLGEEGMIDDQLLDEHLFTISVLSPWFADIEKYLVSAQFPPKFSSKEKSKIVRKSTPFTWIRGNFFKIGPNQILRRELVTNQGSQFTSNVIEDLLSQHKIKHRTSTPYHPQANGQVEVTNRALEGILTKVVRSIRKDWVDRLVEATWAYNTTSKTTTGFTPYDMAYGKKVLLSIEFEYNTLRMAAQLDLDLSSAQKERLL